MIRKIITFGLIPALSLMSILCCDFSKIKTAEAIDAHVFIEKTEKNSTCHCPSNKADASEKDNGNCCISPKLQADLLNKISFSFPQLVLNSLTVLDFLPQQLHVFQAKFSSAYLNGPPRSIFDTPFYIQHHNFRI